MAKHAFALKTPGLWWSLDRPKTHPDLKGSGGAKAIKAQPGLGPTLPAPGGHQRPTFALGDKGSYPPESGWKGKLACRERFAGIETTF